MKKFRLNIYINRQISLVAIFFSLSLILLSLSYFLPILDLLFFLIFPFLASLVSLNTSYKGRLLFLFLAFIVSFIDIQTGFFSYLPYTILGILIGIYLSYFPFNSMTFFMISIFTSIIQMFLIIPTFYIYKINLLYVYSSFFHIDYQFILDYYLGLYLIFSFIEGLFIYLFYSSEINKFKYTHKFNIDNDFYLNIFCLTCFMLLLIFYFVNKNVFYYFLILNTVIQLFLYIKNKINKNKIVNIVDLAVFFIILIIETILYISLHIKDILLIVMPIYSYISIYNLIMLKYPCKNKVVEKDLLK